MRKHRYIALTALFALIVSACSSSTPSSAPAATTAPAASATTAASTEPSASARRFPERGRPRAGSGRSGHPGRRGERRDHLLDVLPVARPSTSTSRTRSPASRRPIRASRSSGKTTRRPSRTTSTTRSRRTSRPDVINLSVSEGWVSDYATKGLLLGLDSTVPKAVQDIYFPGLWKEQLVNGENFQFPWYQGLNVELINKKIYEEGAGLSSPTSPRPSMACRRCARRIKDKTSTLCDIRLTVNDLLSQMVYEGKVDVINDAGTAFTFNSQAGVDWLQMYVDMVAAGTVDNTVLTTNDDRVGLLLFSAGQAAFYATGPNLVRDVKSNNATLYDNLAMQPSPVGKSGVLGKGLMSISVNKSTKFPNASIALAQFFTNPRSMVEFSKQVAVYPSSPSAYDDPYFSATPSTIEDSARPLAKDIISTYQDIVPTIPKKADVNAVVLKAVEQALFNKVPAKQALSDAVAAANKLIQ